MWTLAHAAPVGTVPAQGGALTTPPHELRLEFTQPVELAFSWVRVSAAGRPVQAGSRLRLMGDRILMQSLPDLPPGRYEAAWHVLSFDGHVTEGTQSFTVGTASTAAGFASAPRSSVPRTDTGGSVSLPVILVLVAGLILLCLRYWGRQRRD